MGILVKTRILLAAAAAALAVTGLGAAAGTAHADTLTQHGTYYFNSDSANVNSGDNTIRATPFSPNSVFPDASQQLTANGVQLSATGGSDSGVIYPLGHLSSLFNSNGQFVPPVIDGTGLENYNLYFDTSGDGTFFGYPATATAYTYSSFDGDNKCALGPVNGAAPSVSCDGTWSGNNASTTAIPDAPANEPYTMTKIRAFFAANTTGDTDPLVWAWIGIGDNASGTVTGTVTSVDGSNLVTDTPPPPPTAPVVVLSHGKAVAVAPTRETISWQQSHPSWIKTVITGPGPINGHVGYVDVTGSTGTAVYTGLESGHTYTVHTFPEATKGGASVGTTGYVTFVTEK